MIALIVTVPVACFRKGFAREYWETEDLPAPSTCYGFLLSLVGEFNRRRHIGVRIAPGLLPKTASWTDPSRTIKNHPRYDYDRSAVLRTMWRVKQREKDKSFALGSGGNVRPDIQELLTGIRVLIRVDSTHEEGDLPNLETRVVEALDHPERVDRRCALCLGESTHMIDEIKRVDLNESIPSYTFQLEEKGRVTLPVWVDHVGSRNTRFAVGNLIVLDRIELATNLMPRIMPPM